VEQDLWIHSDGGGELEVRFGVSKKALQMTSAIGAITTDANVPFDRAEIEKQIEADENIIASEIREEEDDDSKQIIVHLTFADITKVGDFIHTMAPDQPDGVGSAESGHFEIELTDTGTYQITADIGPPNTSAPGGIAAGLMSEMFGDSDYVFRVHNPPASDDAHNGRLQDDAVVWIIPLAKLMSGKAPAIEGEFLPLRISGTGDITFWLVLATVLVVSVVLFFVFRAQRPNLG
jgi:hypothetical protein